MTKQTNTTRLSQMLIFALLFSGKAGFAASFDCAESHTTVEHLICASAQLSDFDNDLSVEYHAALRASPQPKQLMAEQRYWLTQVRNLCATQRCLLSVYNARRAALAKRPYLTTTDGDSRCGLPPLKPNPNGCAASEACALMRDHSVLHAASYICENDKANHIDIDLYRTSLSEPVLLKREVGAVGRELKIRESSTGDVAEISYVDGCGNRGQCFYGAYHYDSGSALLSDDGDAAQQIPDDQARPIESFDFDGYWLEGYKASCCMVEYHAFPIKKGVVPTKKGGAEKYRIEISKMDENNVTCEFFDAHDYDVNHKIYPPSKKWLVACKAWFR